MMSARIYGSAELWGGLGLIAVVAVSLVIVLLNDALVARSRRRKHMKTHAPMSDEEFLQKGGFGPEEAEPALALREAFAICMSVPPAAVHPTDQIPKWMTYRELDEALWDRLGVYVPDRFWDKLLHPESETPPPRLLFSKDELREVHKLQAVAHVERIELEGKS